MKTTRFLTITFIVTTIVLATYYLLLTTVSGETATTSSTPPPATIPDKVSELKERIATQVAKLNIIQKRGIVGVISDLSHNQIIVNIYGAKRFIDVDELTKFQATGDKQIGISDLLKNQQISVIGLYNTESRRMLARFIRTAKFQQKITGVVMDIDKKNFTIEMAHNGKSIIIDVEKTTKTSKLTDEDEIVKSGFSEIEIGQKILVVGFPAKEDKFTASRVLLLP